MYMHVILLNLEVARSSGRCVVLDHELYHCNVHVHSGSREETLWHDAKRCWHIFFRPTGNMKNLRGMNMSVQFNPITILVIQYSLLPTL